MTKHQQPRFVDLLHCFPEHEITCLHVLSGINFHQSAILSWQVRPLVNSTGQKWNINAKTNATQNNMCVTHRVLKQNNAPFLQTRSRGMEKWRPGWSSWQTTCEWEPCGHRASRLSSSLGVRTRLGTNRSQAKQQPEFKVKVHRETNAVMIKTLWLTVTQPAARPVRL